MALKWEDHVNENVINERKCYYSMFTVILSCWTSTRQKDKTSFLMHYFVCAGRGVGVWGAGVKPKWRIVSVIVVAEFAVEWPWLAGQKSHTWYSGSLWPKSEFYPWPPANWAMGHCHVTCLWTHDMRHWRKRKYLLVSRYYWKQFMPNEYKTMNFITWKQNIYNSEGKK